MGEASMVEVLAMFGRVALAVEEGDAPPAIEAAAIAVMSKLEQETAESAPDDHPALRARALDDLAALMEAQ